MRLKKNAEKATPKPTTPYVKIQRLGEKEYELTLEDPGNWLAHGHGFARSIRSAEAKAESMLREYAREQGYRRESWIFTLVES